MKHTSYRLPVDEIKQRLSIVDIVSDTVEVRKTGAVYQGMCPFHNNTDTPALAVFPKTQTWYCFGTCGRGGDVISWVMKRDNIPFQDAVRLLAQRAGVEIKDDRPDYSLLYQILERAATIYAEALWKSDDLDMVRANLINKRGLSEDILKRFGIGLALPGGYQIKPRLLDEGYSEQDMLDSGILTVAKSSGMMVREGEVTDMFRSRIMFPIRDQYCHVLGFGARAISDSQQPKFLNSHNNAIFEKGACLYGIDQAVNHIGDLDSAIVVEGYFDVIAMHQMGFIETVGINGTSLTDGHLRTLKQYAKNITMLMDGDEAGEKAVRQALSSGKIDALLDYTAHIDARGIIRSERKFGVRVEVANLPDGKDPDELTHSQIIDVLGESQSITDWLMAHISTGGSRLGASAREKAEKVRTIANIVALIPDPIEADMLCKQAAERFSVGYDVICKAVADASTLSDMKREHKAIQGFSPDVAESEFLKACLVNVYDVYHLDRNLRYAGLDILSRDDFQDEINRSVIDLILDSIDQDDGTPDEYIDSHSDEELLEYISGLRGNEIYGDHNMRVAYMLDALFVLRLARYSALVEALAQGDLSGDEKAGKIAEYVEKKGRISRAMKSLKVNMAKG